MRHEVIRKLWTKIGRSYTDIKSEDKSSDVNIKVVSDRCNSGCKTDQSGADGTFEVNSKDSDTDIDVKSEDEFHDAQVEINSNCSNDSSEANDGDGDGDGNDDENVVDLERPDAKPNNKWEWLCIPCYHELKNSGCI